MAEQMIKELNDIQSKARCLCMQIQKCMQQQQQQQQQQQPMSGSRNRLATNCGSQQYSQRSQCPPPPQQQQQQNNPCCPPPPQQQSNPCCPPPQPPPQQQSNPCCPPPPPQSNQCCNVQPPPPPQQQQDPCQQQQQPYPDPCEPQDQQDDQEQNAIKLCEVEEGGGYVKLYNSGSKMDYISGYFIVQTQKDCCLSIYKIPPCVYIAGQSCIKVWSCQSSSNPNKLPSDLVFRELMRWKTNSDVTTTLYRCDGKPISCIRQNATEE